MGFDLELLEYDKVLEIISKSTDITFIKNKILKLVPKTTKEEVIQLINETSTAVDIINKYGIYEKIISNDLENVINIFEKVTLLRINDINEIYKLLITSKNIHSFFKSININYEILNKFLVKIIVNKQLIDKLESIIDFNTLKVVDNASIKLFNIRKKIRQIDFDIKNSLQDFIRTNISKLSNSNVTYKDNKYTLAVKALYKNDIKGSIIDESSTKETYYIEPLFIKELSYSLIKLLEEEKEEVDLILSTLTLYIKTYSADIISTYENIIDLDVVFSKAFFSRNFKYIPVINDQKSSFLDHIKHPLINEQICIASTLNIKDNYQCYLISGANTGGKSVLLKLIGLFHLLNQTGILLESKKNISFHIYSSIYITIDNLQSISNNLSSFSSQISNVNKILEDNNLDNSLILFDELCSQTDPNEGSALAISIINYLLNKNAKVVLTSHFSLLKEYAYTNPKIHQISMEFNLETLKPTYKILDGIPGDSHCFSISKLLGLKDEIISDANLYYNEVLLKKEFIVYDKLIKELKLKELELEDENKKIKDIKNDLQLEIQKINSRKNDIIKEALEEKNIIINEAKQKANKILEDIKTINDNTNLAQIAKIKGDINSLDINTNTSITYKKDYLVGDYVYVKKFLNYGYITKIKKDKVTVLINNFSIDFNFNEIEPAEELKTKKIKEIDKKNNKYNGYTSINNSFLDTLDLRGKRYDEVKELVEQFIDQAILSHSKEIKIIHGYGTGTVRNRVYEILKDNKFVKDKRYGKEGEGLSGVTILTLK